MTTRSVPAGSAVSACHTIAGARPETRRSARAMSRSRLIPGKTSTADFIDALALDQAQKAAAIEVFIVALAAVVVGEGVLSQIELRQNLNPIILDHRVGEELFGCVLQRRLGADAIGAFDLDVEHLALAHVGNAANAERAQRALNGFALRIENAGFQCDGDSGFHRWPWLAQVLLRTRCRLAHSRQH